MKRLGSALLAGLFFMPFAATAQVAPTAPPIAAAASLGPSRRALRAVLDYASSPALLRSACDWVAASLSDGASTGRTPERDASFASLDRFVRSRRDIAQRARCLRNAQVLSMAPTPNAGSSVFGAYAGPYTHDVEALQDAMFSAPRESDRLVAALASRADYRPRTGRLLLAAATRDRSRRVRAAALNALNWPMHADITSGTPRSTYERAIRSALTDADPAIVVAALRAYVALHELPQSDATLRHYALAANPLVRAGALQAYDTYPQGNPAVRAFVETRLDDPAVAVRVAAIQEFTWINDAHTRTTLQRIVARGRTAAERDEARSQLRALVSDQRP